MTETFVCPSILDNVSIGTSFAKTTVVANVCRAMWLVKGFFKPISSAMILRLLLNDCTVGTVNL